VRLLFRCGCGTIIIPLGAPPCVWSLLDCSTVADDIGWNSLLTPNSEGRLSCGICCGDVISISCGGRSEGTGGGVAPSGATASKSDDEVLSVGLELIALELIALRMRLIIGLITCGGRLSMGGRAPREYP